MRNHKNKWLVYWVVGGGDMKYETVRSVLKNGDICELKTWDGKIIFGFYMDGYLYKD